MFVRTFYKSFPHEPFFSSSTSLTQQATNQVLLQFLRPLDGVTVTVAIHVARRGAGHHTLCLKKELETNLSAAWTCLTKNFFLMVQVNEEGISAPSLNEESTTDPDAICKDSNMVAAAATVAKSMMESRFLRNLQRTISILSAKCPLLWAAPIASDRSI